MADDKKRRRPPMDFDLDDLEELEREHAEQMAGQTLDDLEQLEREAEAQAAASEGLTRRDALRQGLLGIVAVGAGLEATREGVMQVMEDKDESYGKPTRTQEHLETVVEHEVTTPIFLNHRFDKYPTDGSGHFKSYMRLFGEVFGQKANQATYYDLDGDVLGEITLPDDWHKKGRNAKQAWHNDNRRNIAKDYYVTPTEWNKTGYPLSAVPRVVGIPDEEQHKSPPLADIEKRLKEKVADPRYFDGEEVVYMDAIRVICEEYGVPVNYCLGLGSNESSFQREAGSEAGAKGIFQFLPSTADAMAIPYVKKNPSFREGNIAAFQYEWKNRLVQAELFCAHYKYLEKTVAPTVQALTKRLRSIDAGFNANLMPMAIANAYHGGQALSIGAMERFMELPDEAIRARLGNEPYGLDVWLAVLAHSYQQEFGEDEATLGTHSFHYPIKICAFASLFDAEFLAQYDPPRQTREQSYKKVGGLGLLAAVTAWLFNRKAKQDPEPNKGAKGVTRRAVLLGGAAGATAAVAGPGLVHGPGLIKRISRWWEQRQQYKEVRNIAEGVPHIENYSKVAKAAKDALTKRHRGLRQQIEDGNGRKDYSSDAEVKATQIYIDEQIRLMEGEPGQRNYIEEAFHGDDGKGADFVSRYRAGTGGRAALYTEGQERQEHLTKRALESGDFVPIHPGSDAVVMKIDFSSAEGEAGASIDESYVAPEVPADYPIYAEQVGMNYQRRSEDGRTMVNGDALAMRKEFVPIMYLMTETVNHQIDLINKARELDPAAYGSDYADLPVIPHVKAFKVSGAFRPMLQGYVRSSGAQAGSTTKKISPHYIGHGLDFASMSTKDSESRDVDATVLQFKEAMMGPGGDVILPEGGYLPCGEYKDGDLVGDHAETFDKIRTLLSRVIRRSLIAIQDPLEQEMGIKMRSLWEAGQLNWHIAVRPAEEAFEAPDSAEEELNEPEYLDIHHASDSGDIGVPFEIDED